MKTYQVFVTRTSTYEVSAKSADAAIDSVVAGDVYPVSEETESMEAQEIKRAPRYRNKHQ